MESNAAGMPRSPSTETFVDSVDGFAIGSPRGVPNSGGASMWSWTSNDHISNSDLHRRSTLRSNVQAYDANALVPWKLELSAKGSMTFHLLDCSFHHDDTTSSMLTQSSQFKTRGSFAVWKASHIKGETSTPSKHHRSASFHRAALAAAAETPSGSHSSFPR